MKICKNCKHVERGFFAFFKSVDKLICTKDKDSYIHGVTGKRVNHYIFCKTCNERRLAKAVVVAGIPFGGECGIDAIYFEDKKSKGEQPNE